MPNKEPNKEPAKRPKIKGKRTMMGGKATEIEIKPQLKIRVRSNGSLMTEAVVIFGRMNPPTRGHERLVEAAAMVAREKDAVPLLFLSQSVNAKNPLRYTEKLDLCEQAFGTMINVIRDPVKDPLDLLRTIAENFESVTVITGSDGTSDYTRILKEYNGIEFNFKTTEVITVDRDFQSDSLEEMITASSLREAVVTNDFEAFKQGVPSKLTDKAELVFEQVKFGLSLQNISEDTMVDKARKAIINLRNKK